VLDETGVPQQPAVRTGDHRVFYAQRDDVTGIHYYQPAVGKKTDSFGLKSGWFGRDTYEDNDSYTIKVPTYPTDWNLLGVGVVSSSFGAYGSSLTGVTFTVTRYRGIKLQGPISVVPYYEPIWTETPLPPRLANFRAAINPVQGRLIQHREVFTGEIVRQQTGKNLVGYLYRDANGVIARNASDLPYGVLGSDFDPTNPPASFSSLASPSMDFYAYPADIVLCPSVPSQAQCQSIPWNDTLDANAPFAPAQLRQPTQVDLHTFGHCYLTKALNQPGGRYRTYLNYGTTYAEPTSIAVDEATGMTFYTQTPPPAGDQDTPPATEESPTPLSGFAQLPDPKLSPPTNKLVWIVVVY
jgi:hypothetical protein